MEGQPGNAGGGSANSGQLPRTLRRGLKVSADGRALDAPELRSQGIGRYAQGLLSSLAQVAADQGGELVVIRLRQGEGSPFGASGGPSARGLSVRHRPGPGPLAQLVDQALLPLSMRRAGGAVHHALSIYGVPIRARLPVVVTLHDVAPLQWPHDYLRTGLAHRALYRAARRAAAIICPSRAVHDDVLDHLAPDPARVRVISEGVDESFRPTDAAGLRARLGLDGPYLLYVGSLVEADARKDVEGLIDAFATWARAESRPETLVLAGALGPAGEELERRATADGARVRFTGFVKEEDLPALYSGASCFVTATRYEGFGLPALEAIACGTPVAAYNAGAIPETAGPGALLAAPFDQVGLMRRVAEICNDESLEQRLAGEGRRHASQFSWRRAAEETWRVYETVAR